MSLKGKSIVFTGTLSQTRSEATSLAEKAGATVKGTITSSTSYVIAGADAGKKLADAKKKGVIILTEEEFKARCGGAGAALGGEKKKTARAADSDSDGAAGTDDDDDEKEEKADLKQQTAKKKTKQTETVTFVFVDTTNDDEETDEMEFNSDTSMSTVLHDAAEQFGFESGASVNARGMKQKGTAGIVPRTATAGVVFEQYGKKLAIVPREEKKKGKKKGSDDDEE